MTLEIIGAGFGRTGTNSLRRAVEMLGFGPCHHMYEVRENESQIAFWERAISGAQVDWEEGFRGYRSQVDWPGAHFWRQLAALYPDAKVLLSVRDPNGWYDSMSKTIIPILQARGQRATPLLNRLSEVNHELINMQTFGGRVTDRAHAIGVFNAHIAEVQASLPAGRLLTMDVREGWGPLCRFLGVEVPDIPFPSSNSAEEFNKTSGLPT